MYVETEGGRALPYRTIQAIPAILAANVRDLAPESITVMDSRGNRYLDPGNPALGDDSRNRAREEEIGEEIVEKLYWIKGVRVQVQVITPRAEDSTRRDERDGRHEQDKRPIRGSRPHPAEAMPVRGEHQGSPSQPKMRCQSAAGLMAIESPDWRPRRRACLHSRLRRARDLARGETAGRARSRALFTCRAAFTSICRSATMSADPSPEERLVMAERTEKQIRTAVALVLPASDSWKVEVDTMPDEVALSRPAILPGTPGLRHRFLEWAIVGGVGVGVSILAIAGIVDPHGATAGAAARARGQVAALSRRFRVKAQPVGARSRADRAQPGSRGKRAAAMGRSWRPLFMTMVNEDIEAGRLRGSSRAAA